MTQTTVTTPAAGSPGILSLTAPASTVIITTSTSSNTDLAVAFLTSSSVLVPVIGGAGITLPGTGGKQFVFQGLPDVTRIGYVGGTSPTGTFSVVAY